MKDKILTVLSTELDSFLTGLGVFDDYKEGRLKCDCCKDVITYDNFQAVLRKGDNLLFACNKEMCVLWLGTKQTESSNVV